MARPFDFFHCKKFLRGVVKIKENKHLRVPKSEELLIKVFSAPCDVFSEY